MTQVNRAQGSRRELALRPRADKRSLAQRRADFAAQMRAMALSDLQQVADRLKRLHERLERKEARKITQQDLAREIGIPYRTYQAWAGAKNENRSGDGYDRIVRFYRRKLSDKTITRNWLVFGEDAAVQSETMAAEETKPGRVGQLDHIEWMLSQLLDHFDIEDIEELEQLAADDDQAPAQAPGQTGEQPG